MDAKRIRSRNAGQKGQAAVEFALAAPSLFFLFFAIIQFSYLAYASLAVQKAALAIARSATLSTDRQNDRTAYKTQLALALYPLSRLDRRTLMSVLSSEVTVAVSPDEERVTARVRYPMPLWVPLAGRILGRTLDPITGGGRSSELQTVRAAFQKLGLPAPELSGRGVPFPVRWIDYTGTVFNESHRPR